jgi:hypothetical protein
MSFENVVRPFDEGVEITVPGHVLCVPELSLFQREQHQTDIAALASPTLELRDKTDLIIKLIALGLSRHYPDVTEADVRDKFTAQNINRAFQAVVNVRGAVPKAPAAESGQSTGTKSTETS